MAILNRVRVTWSGVPGGGLSTFYCVGTSPDVSALKTFFTSVAPYLPPAVSVSIPASGDTIESTNGALQGAWTGSGGGTVTGSGNSAYNDSIGMTVVWNTTAIPAKHRLKGRTFICPLAQGFASTNGTLNDAIVGAVQLAAATLAAAGLLEIWHRPTKALPNSGSFAVVSSAVVPDRVTALRSRRF